MSEAFNIALIGCGTVGTGVARLLLENADRLTARAGRPLVLRHVVVRKPSKQRQVSLPPNVITDDFSRVLDDPEVHVGVELVGGTDWRQTAVRALLLAGKHVVTANKALLAQCGHAIFETARENNRTVAFEASVGGGIPIVSAIAQGLAANQVVALQGILNGTCNYILTGMSDQRLTYVQALEQAQRLGFAEADPTLDVSGIDTAHKLAILAKIAFRATIPLKAIDCRGIADVQEMDIRFARELGYTIKLLAEAWLDPTPDAATGGRGLALHVSPVLLRHQAPLAQVRGPYNAIQVVGDAVGDTLYYGRGAGAMPTASAVVADLIDLAIGRGQRTFATLQPWASDAGIVPRSPATVRSRFYLRLLVPDRPGVLGEVARDLAGQQISISSVIQHEAQEEHEGDLVPLVIMTHTATTQSFRAALTDIVRSGIPHVYYPVAD